MAMKTSLLREAACAALALLAERFSATAALNNDIADRCWLRLTRPSNLIQ
jgi:hypothetical protein